MFFKAFLHAAFWIIVIAGNLFSVQAAQGIASTGLWRQSSSWLIGGQARTPTCGDTLLIPPGVTITLDDQQNYSLCAMPMRIIVQGTFQLVNGFKITLPCNSSVSVSTGGIVKKATPGGGNSTYISICNCVSWTAAMGQVNGPATIACTTLPVSLISFSASQSGNSISLTWITASEINNSYFTIERSFDGEIFEVAGSVPGSGNSSTIREYSFLDQVTRDGIVYYRLRQTDFDGTTTLSDLVAVRIDVSEELDVHDVLVTGDVMSVRFEHPVSDPIDVSLYNMTGIELLERSFPSGIRKAKFPLPDLPQGVYILSIRMSEEQINERIFIE